MAYKQRTAHALVTVTLHIDATLCSNGYTGNGRGELDMSKRHGHGHGPPHLGRKHRYERHLPPASNTFHQLARKQSSKQISTRTRQTLSTQTRTMHFSMSAVLLAVLRVAAESTTAYPPMGPAAFMWPTDRPWSADTDNIAPCGSSSGVGPRTEFPMSECASTNLSQHELDQCNEHDYYAQSAPS